MGVPIRPRPTKAIHGTRSHYPAEQARTTEDRNVGWLRPGPRAVRVAGVVTAFWGFAG
jgi:hypothetical protein